MCVVDKAWTAVSEAFAPTKPLSGYANPAYSLTAPKTTQLERVDLIELGIKEFFTPSGLSQSRIQLVLQAWKGNDNPFMMALYTFLGVKVFKNGANLAEIRTLFYRDLPNTKYKPLSGAEKEMAVAAENVREASRKSSSRRGLRKSAEMIEVSVNCLDEFLHIVQWDEKRLQSEAGKATGEQGTSGTPKKVRGRTLFVDFLGFSYLWAGGTFSVLEDEMKVSTKGVRSYLTRSHARNAFRDYQESIVKGKLVMNDDGFIEYQETPKYNAMLRGGQTAEVEEWIIQACEGYELETIEDQYNLVLGRAEFGDVQVRRAFRSSLFAAAQEFGFKGTRSQVVGVATRYCEAEMAKCHQAEQKSGWRWTEAEHSTVAKQIRKDRGTIWNNLASALPTRRLAAIMLHLRHDHVKEIIRKIMRQQGSSKAEAWMYLP